LLRRLRLRQPSRVPQSGACIPGPIIEYDGAGWTRDLHHRSKQRPSPR
jgi:hypothetical protein